MRVGTDVVNVMAAYSDCNKRIKLCVCMVHCAKECVWFIVQRSTVYDSLCKGVRVYGSLCKGVRVWFTVQRSARV